MASAFKLFPEDETETGGEFGTSPFGQESFGGTEQATKYVLPPNEIPGDDPSAQWHQHVAESQLRRQGKLLSARKYDSWKQWDFVFTMLEQYDLLMLSTFFNARRFKFIPNELDEQTYFEVHWVDTEFRPPAKRGAYYELEFSIEEM